MSLTTNFVSDGGATQERLQDAVHQRDEDEASVDDNVNNEESKSGSDDLEGEDLDENLDQ